MTADAPAPRNQSGVKKMPGGIVFFLGIIVVVLIAFIGLYVAHGRSLQNLSESDSTLSLANFFKSPVVTVNGKKVLYTEYVADMQTLRQFYDVQGEGIPPVSDDDISDQVISRLVINNLIAQTAKQFDVDVDSDEVASARSEIVQGTFQTEENANAELQKQYGWDLDTYVEKVVRPILLEQNVQRAFAEREDIEVDEQYVIQEIRARHILFRAEEGEDEARVLARAQEVLDRITGGEDFEALAREFGSDNTAEQGGDLGWFGPGVMVPSFEDAAFALAVGEVTGEPVQSQFGYHIIKKEEERTSRDFLRYMNDALTNADIQFRLPIHDPFEALRAGELGAAQPPVEIVDVSDSEVNEVEIEPELAE